MEDLVNVQTVDLLDYRAGTQLLFGVIVTEHGISKLDFLVCAQQKNLLSVHAVPKLVSMKQWLSHEFLLAHKGWSKYHTMLF